MICRAYMSYLVLCQLDLHTVTWPCPGLAFINRFNSYFYSALSLLLCSPLHTYANQSKMWRFIQTQDPVCFSPEAKNVFLLLLLSSSVPPRCRRFPFSSLWKNAKEEKPLLRGFLLIYSFFHILILWYFEIWMLHGGNKDVSFVKDANISSLALMV